jgi:hypothetical protein
LRCERTGGGVVRQGNSEAILSNIARAEELAELLTEFNVTDVHELRAVIEKHATAPRLLPVTEQIIASLGITSVRVDESARRTGSSTRSSANRFLPPSSTTNIK